MTLATTRDPDGDRTGFGGARYRTERRASRSYPDRYDDYLAFLEPRLREARRVLATDGTLYFHIDYREAHYCKLLLDEIFGRDAFLNEIIWAYDYGGRAQAPLAGQARHDPRLRQGPRALLLRRRGGRPRAVHGAGPRRRRRRRRAASCRPTCGGTRSSRPTGAEKTGYPTQKPLGVLRRIVQASSREGDWCLDFFAGSGTLGAAALELGRRCVLCDSNPEAVEVMRAPARPAGVRRPRPSPRRARPQPADLSAARGVDSPSAERLQS